MTELLTSEQMRRLEKLAIDSGEVTGLELMERAGQGVCDAIFEHWPEWQDAELRAAVFCGPGNNGGDGFVIARLLASRGWGVDVYLYGAVEKLPPDARANHDRWIETNPVCDWQPDGFREKPRPDLIVDAVFGIGLTRHLPDEVAVMLDRSACAHWKQAYKIRKVAVDCPSGLNLDSGMIPFAGDADDPDFNPWPTMMNAADLTVTFHSPKPGHYLGMGPLLCQKLRVVNIGLRGDALEKSPLMAAPDPERARLVEPVFAGRPLRRWPASLMSKMQHGGHKYEHGHVMVLAGGVGRGGAARLAARSALRVGAGLVTVVCPPAALQENAARLDAVMLNALPKDGAIADVADDRVSGFVLGPGMGVSDETHALVLEALERRAGQAAGRDPVVVLDADALTSFADSPETLFKAVHTRTILTPHEGEFGRLFPDLCAARRGHLSKLDVARLAAARAGCLILLKGVDTVIAGPDGAASLHSASFGRAVPWLATAGAGDVLAGLIAGLAASEVSGELFNMAEVAVWLHVEAAHAFGPGLIAEDLVDILPEVLRAQLA